MSPIIGMVLTEADINEYNEDTYDRREDFAECVIRVREMMDVDDFDLLSGMEKAAGERCFGYGTRRGTDGPEEPLDISLYGESLDIRGVIEYVKEETTLKISELSLIDNGWEPACVVLTLVEAQTDTVWA